MKCLSIIIAIAFCVTNVNGQTGKMKTLVELINTQDPGWDLVKQWIKEAKNNMEVLPKDSKRADNALYESQVTTRSPMGAVIYETGGILVDNGWIRILGSGCKQFDRSLMDWNKGKSFTKLGDQLRYLLIADDVIGGFFAINAGAFGQTDIGKVFYFAPDNLKWESIGLSYSNFLIFCFSGDIKKFYDGFQWAGWKKDMKTVDGNQGISCFPFLFTEEGKDINEVSRKVVPIQELWDLHNDLQKQFEK